MLMPFRCRFAARPIKLSVIITPANLREACENMTELVRDLEAYEAFVQGHPKGHFMQSVFWAKQKPQWDWEALVSRDEAGNIRGSLALLFRRIGPWTMAYGCRGPVCDPNDEMTLQELCVAAKALAQSRRTTVLRIDPDIPAENRSFAECLRSMGFQTKAGTNLDQIQPRWLYRLPLAGKDEAALLAGFHPKTRYNIRLAARKGVEVRVCGEEAVPAFSALMEETGHRDGFVTRPASYFTALLHNLGDHARLYMAYWEGKPLAGAIAIQYGDKTWYLYGASSGQHRDKMPNYLLQWEMIRWALAGGCRLYDFRGVSGSYGENRPIEGLYRFKSGFRGELVELMEEQDLVLRPASYRLMRAALILHGMLHRPGPTHRA